MRSKREGVLLVRRALRRDEDPRSFIGGLPRLREELQWPVSAKTGRPLSFLAQLDLRDVPRPSGVFFPAEGMLWFFADFGDGRFFGDQHTRVLFDPHPGAMPPEREAPANLRSLHDYAYGWEKARHPRAFVEPKTGLFLHLVDTFPDRPRERVPGWQEFLDALKKPWPRRDENREADRMQKLQELREDAVHRATGVRRGPGGFWYRAKSGFGEPHWPPTSIDAEYALMSVAGHYRFTTNTEAAARLHERARILRDGGARALAPEERDAINDLIAQEIDAVQLDRRDAVHAIQASYPHAAFEIVRTMPDAAKYVRAELLDPYQEWTTGEQMYLHQMFGHGSSPQSAPATYEARGYVLLLQLGGSATLGFPLSGDAVMHYWIPKSDLAAGRFDRVEGTWEAG